MLQLLHPLAACLHRKGQKAPQDPLHCATGLQPASKVNMYLPSFDCIQRWHRSVWNSKTDISYAHDRTDGPVTGAGNLNLTLPQAALTRALFTGNRVGPRGAKGGSCQERQDAHPRQHPPHCRTVQEECRSRKNCSYVYFRSHWGC